MPGMNRRIEVVSYWSGRNPEWLCFSLPIGHDTSLLSGKTKPGLQFLESPVHSVGRVHGKRDMPVAYRDLFFGVGLAKLGHGGDVKRCSQSGSVGPRLTVN